MMLKDDRIKVLVFAAVLFTGMFAGMWARGAEGEVALPHTFDAGT